MILLALALAGSPLPDPVKHPRAYERYTHGEFVCDDHPWRSRGCGLSPRERRLARIAERICGPDGAVDYDPTPAHPQGWPHCNRNGWNGHRYVDGR